MMVSLFIHRLVLDALLFRSDDDAEHAVDVHKDRYHPNIGPKYVGKLGRWVFGNGVRICGCTSLYPTAADSIYYRSAFLYPEY